MRHHDGFELVLLLLVVQGVLAGAGQPVSAWGFVTQASSNGCSHGSLKLESSTQVKGIPADTKARAHILCAMS